MFPTIVRRDAEDDGNDVMTGIEEEGDDLEEDDFPGEWEDGEEDLEEDTDGLVFGDQ